MLRFFEERPFAEIGRALGMSEDAARMRVERALEKLEQALARRGVKSTAAALGLALANQAGVAAPAGVAASVAGVAVAGTGALGGAAEVANFMSTSKSVAGISGLLATLSLFVAFRQRHLAVEAREALQVSTTREQSAVSSGRELEERLRTAQKRADAAEQDVDNLLRAVNETASRNDTNGILIGGPLTHEQVQTRYGRALALAKAGDSDAALSEFLWCFDDGMARVSSFRVARRGALLDALARLAARHPAASVALLARRERAEQAMLGTDYDIDALQDFVALNRVLAQPGRTFEVYDRLADNDPKRGALATAAYEQFAAAKRYDDAARGRSYNRMERDLERLVAPMSVTFGVTEAEEIRKNHHDHVLKSTLTDIEVLAGLGEVAQAQELARRLLAFDGSEETRRLIRERAIRAGRPDSVP